MPLTKTYKNEALKLGFAHLFVTSDADVALTGGWRYLGRSGTETVLVIGEQKLGIELGENRGAQFREYTGAPHAMVRTGLSELTLQNISETRPGSVLFVDGGGDPIAVGIGKADPVDLTPTLPTLLLVPEWCDLAAMAADPTHADWLDVVFLWRAVASEQGQFQLNPQNVAISPVTFAGVYAKTPAGMAQTLAEAYSLLYEGNPKNAPVANPMNAIGAALVMPDLSALLPAFDPASFRDEEYDAYYGDAFKVGGGGMDFVGRMRGARSLTFGSVVATTTTEYTGQTPIKAYANGAQAAAEITVMELGKDVLLRQLRAATEVEDAGAATVGVGVGGASLTKVTTPKSLLLRPASAGADRSRDIILWHAVPDGDFEQAFRRSARDATLRFQGRFWDGAQVPDGAKVALWGDAVAAGAAITIDS